MVGSTIKALSTLAGKLLLRLKTCLYSVELKAEEMDVEMVSADSVIKLCMTLIIRIFLNTAIYH